MIRNLLLASLTIILLFSCKSQINSDSNEDSIQLDTEFKPKQIQFPSLDDLPITAHLYEVNPDAPIIILCHQARFNKSEYNGIAQRLMELGFNSIALDQRSGGPIANYINETVLVAKKKDLPTDYLDAEQDIIAAVNYAAKQYNEPVILWGSSYSSTLALYIAAENKNVSAVISFSPGDYFKEEKGSLREVLTDFKKPMFVTSSNYESTELNILMYDIGLGENQVQFIPEGAGHHGSRALWPSQTGGEEYWAAIEAFLINIK